MKTPLGRVLATLFFALAILPCAKFAQAQGEDNPTGITGIFNGNSTTGCSYGAYTGNATRTIIDLAVPGAVGAYRLQWTRTMNSRWFAYAPFGAGGDWSPAYQWIATAASGSGATPSSYAVSYPDGRYVQFSPSVKGDTAYNGPAGTSDRFQPVNGTGACYLLLPDGGKVSFQQTATGSWPYDFTLKPTQLIDPYGLVTTLTTDASGRITQVTEPAGRWLKITYSGSNITRVDTGYGTSTVTQSVTYSYVAYGGYTVLNGASYSDGTSASYTYQASNMTVPPPTITVQPANRAVSVGQTAAFSVTATGVAPLSYQWRKNGVNIAGATSASYTTPATTTADNGALFAVVVSNSGGSVTSNNAQLTVNPAQVASVAITDDCSSNGCYPTSAHVTMSTATAGATIFYANSQSGFVVPTHSGATPTGSTLIYSGSITVPAGTAKYFEAVGYKSGMTDSGFTQFVEDNTNPGLSPPPGHSTTSGGDGPVGMTTAQTASSYIDLPLIKTCSDVRYPGPMKNIAYDFVQGGSYGQLLREKYVNGANVSTVTVTGANTRTETRGDGPARTLTYSAGMLTNWTDFKGSGMSQTRDGNSYVNSFTDANGHIRNMEREKITGRITSLTHPPDVNGVRSSVTYVYKDPANPYYLDHVTDELGHTTTYLRDANHRVYEIDYPDGGKETFTYNGFGEVLSHGLTTGGSESFLYDPRGLKQSFTNADGKVTTYDYDALDRVSAVHDPRANVTDLRYNQRGQLTQTIYPPDPVDGLRHTVTNAPNDDGTLASVTDQLSHVTTYTYDDYKRLRTIVTSQRFAGDSTPHTTTFWYEKAGNAVDDYTHTDANVRRTALPSGKVKITLYDNNFWKTSVTVGAGTIDAATTRYGYDAVGNLTTVQDPRGYYITTSFYDQRNRLTDMDDPIATDRNSLGHTISCTYDQAGNKLSEQRANNQLITYNSYDPMNRLLQQTVSQAPNPAAVTKYTYYPSGLLHTMQDPHLVASGSSSVYNYVYDFMRRKSSVTYPPDSSGATGSESYIYDPASNLATFTNRAGKLQTFTYDALNRMTGFTWNDGVTPSVTLGYDVASRLSSIVNASATISRTYFNDNLLNSETSTYADNTARTATYTYDPDGDRATIQYPSGAYSFTYNYTGRNQLKTLVDNSSASIVATYAYDPDGNLSTRTPDNSTSCTYSYDALDRVTQITHSLVSGNRTFDYAYDTVGNRKWTKRDGGTGDVFGYDLNDQVTATLLNIANPDTTAPGSPTINYDANGNRTTFSAYGPTDTYTTNNLNQYSSRNSSQATYDNNGNMTTGMDGLVYSYDAQNRLLSATKNANTETYAYDGLNRQVSRTVNGVTTYNVYDGWNLVGEYASGATSPSAAYVYGASGLVKNVISGNYYYQDGSGSTSHLADSAGNLLEWYRYDLQGTPIFYNAANSQIANSRYGIRHLFTGQQYYKTVGLYDLRNRFYSPDIGRFLQPDLIDFDGDATNLYRYCGNNPVNAVDPMGLNVYWVKDGIHGYVGVTDPTNSNGGVTYFDFGPVEHPDAGIVFNILYDIIQTLAPVPGHWDVNREAEPQWVVYDTWQTTPEQDAAVQNALYEHTNAQDDWYNTIFSNCYSLPKSIVGSALSGGGGNYFYYVVMSDNTVYKYNSNWNYVGHIDGNSGRAQYNQIGSGISIGPTSFESATTGLIGAFERGTSTGNLGLILGGLPGGSAYPLGHGPYIL